MAVLRNRVVLVASLVPMLACTFNAGGLGQSGEPATTGSSSVGVSSSGPTGEPPTTGAPSSAGPGGEMSATGSTGPVDPDTTATATTNLDTGVTSGTSEPVTGSSSSTTTTTAGDESSTGGTTGCVEQEYFKDGDGDGFGDPNMKSAPSCEPPPGFVEDATDCDDKNNATNPDAPEKCGMGDNDCDKVVDEFEPNSNAECGGCKMYLYPANNRVYYFCSMTRSWADAKGECEKRGGVLAKDIDTAHHDWLVNLLPLKSGPWWLGATSPNGDSKFTWLDGTSVPNPDPRWSTLHPIILGDDRIVLVSNGNLDFWADDNGRWVDRGDIDKQPYICESAYLP